MAETTCDPVHCPTLGNKHWMFDPRLADVVNKFAHFHTGLCNTLSFVLLFLGFFTVGFICMVLYLYGALFQVIRLRVLNACL